jgi:hypothetical protein
MSSGTCEFRPVDYKPVKPGRNVSVLAFSASCNTCRRSGEDGDVTRCEQLCSDCFCYCNIVGLVIHLLLGTNMY